MSWNERESELLRTLCVKPLGHSARESAEIYGEMASEAAKYESDFTTVRFIARAAFRFAEEHRQELLDYENDMRGLA